MFGQNSTAATPEDYIAQLDEPRRAEIQAIHDFIRKAVPKLEPFIIKGMLAYGPYHYKYASGREGDWCKIALASNKGAISLYLCVADDKGYLAEQNKHRVGKASVGKSCIRFKKWDDLDHKVMKELIKKAEKLKFGL
jgi:hypothetical protein